MSMPILKITSGIFQRTLVVYLVAGLVLAFLLDKKVIQGNFLAHTKDYGRHLSEFHYKERELTRQELLEAVTYYKALKNYIPSPALCYANMGFGYFYMRDIDSAVASYQKAVELEPRWYSFYYDLGIMSLMTNNISTALPLFEQALEFIPKERGDYLKFLGRPGAHQKELNQEISFLDQRVRFDYEQIFVNLTRGYFQMQDFGSLLRTALKGVGLFPGNAELNYFAGFGLFMAGTYPDAALYLTRTVEIDPNYSEGYYYRALCAQRLGQEMIYQADVRRALQTKDVPKKERGNPYRDLHAYPDSFVFFKIYSMTDRSGMPSAKQIKEPWRK